jgi:tyrosyl-tRNA synthetase
MFKKIVNPCKMFFQRKMIEEILKIMVSHFLEAKMIQKILAKKMVHRVFGEM